MMNIVMPMAGDGSRFKQAGYTTPKPFLTVPSGETLLDLAIKPFVDMGEVTFIARSEHADRLPQRHLVTVDHLTEGAACTVLLAKDRINNDSPLMIVNSDQIVSYSRAAFFSLRSSRRVDGAVFTFESRDPKFSYIGEVDGKTRLAEKEVISNQATCGVYYFNRGRDFVWAAEQMISQNKRVRGEFFLAPVYNEILDMGGVIVPFRVNEMICLGTPEEYEAYCASWESFRS